MGPIDWWSSAVEVEASTGKLRVNAGQVKASATTADFVPAWVAARKTRSLLEEVELNR